MNPIKFPALCVTVLSFLVPLTPAATLVIDSFSEGNVDLAHSGPRSDYARFPGTFFDERFLGGPVFSAWSASVKASEGTFTFTTGLRELEPEQRISFILTYSRSEGAFNLLGYEGFALRVKSMTGKGDLFIDGSDSPENTIRVPFEGPGTLFYSMENITSGVPLGELFTLTFVITPLSTDFSITLEEISLVPEPGSAGLLLAAGSALVSTRRRRPGVSI